MPRRLIKPTRIFFSNSSVLLGIWIAILMSPIWMALFSKSPVEYGQMPLKIVAENCFEATCSQPAIHPGDTLVVRVERINHTKAEITYPITRQLRDVNTGDVQLLNSASTTVAPGHTTAISRLHTIPTSVVPGRYTLYGTATVPGAYRNHVLSWYTEPFDVIPGASNASPSAGGSQLP